jgi:O-methyltransferase
MVTDLLKLILTVIGSRTPQRVVHGLNATANYLEAGRWLHAHGFSPIPRFRNREALFDENGGRIALEKILYLEFGVYRGKSIAHWARLLENPESQLHGFDSFEGLPENWNMSSGKGEFSTDGIVPTIVDPRVIFHKGWFQETLPQFVVPPHDRLVIHLDADLYSSTIYVLQTLRTHIVVGAILQFDEFCDRQHELKAFDEFLSETGMKFRLIGANQTLAQAAFQRTG